MDAVSSLTSDQQLLSRLQQFRTTRRFVLVPILFTVYTSSMAMVAEAHNVTKQQYADDTQLHAIVSRSNGNS